MSILSMDYDADCVNNSGFFNLKRTIKRKSNNRWRMINRAINFCVAKQEV